MVLIVKSVHLHLLSVWQSSDTLNERCIEVNLSSPFHPEAGLSSLRQKGALVMEQMCSQPAWSLEETESPAGEQQDNVQHIQAVMEEMQLRKQR